MGNKAWRDGWERERGGGGQRVLAIDQLSLYFVQYAHPTAERYGYKPVILASLFYLTAITAMFFCAKNIQTLLAAEVLAGELRRSLGTLVLC